MAANPKILFLCTGNSCRSQIAEGLCHSLRGDLFEVYSAGIETHGLNPNAVKVCDTARESCSFFPAKTRLVHHSFEDPPKLAVHAKTEEEKLGHYRRVRDEIKEFVLSLPEALETGRK